MGDSKRENLSFVYNSFKGDIRYDIQSTKPKEPSEIILKVSYDDTKPIKFAYQYGDGLIRIDKNVNKKRAHNILGEFLNINHNDLNGYINFFNEHGFLFELEPDRFSKIEIEDIAKISKRLQTLIDLINEVNSIDGDIYKIFGISLSLLLDEPWKISTSEQQCYTAAKSKLSELIKNNDFTSFYRLSEYDEFQKGYFEINDTFYKKYELNSSDYRKIINGSYSKKGSDDFYFKSITYIYANYEHLSNKEKEIIDCLFHYYYEVGVPYNVEIGEPLKHYSHIDDNAVFDSVLYDSILNFAKYIIKNEIDWMIRNIKPVYDEDTMQPDWKVDSLLSAMYFSLFFMDSKNEMLKRCKHCGRLFQVKRSSSNNLYCDSYCRNNAQQAKHRLKLKQINK